MSDEIPVICLIGSSKFKLKFHEVAERLEKKGCLILMMGFFQHSDNRPVSAEERQVLERVDRKRIDMSDIVLVIHEDYYIGESTSLEIDYATSKEKPLYYGLETVEALICSIEKSQ